MDFKKIMILLLVLLLVIGVLAGCTLKNDSEDGDLPLVDIVEKLTEGVEVPMYETIPLSEDTFEFFAFIPYRAGLSGVQADALVNITPHSLVIVNDENGEAPELAKLIFENADTRKWLCVEAETVTVANTDHYILLVMSDADTAAAITANFKALSEDLKDGEFNEYVKGA